MKPLKITIALVLLAVFGVIVWQAVKPSDEPVYKGRTLTSWLGDSPDVSWALNFKNLAGSYQWEAGYGTGVGRILSGEAADAVRHIGVDAIPTLLRHLRGGDSAFTARLRELAQRQHIVNLKLKPLKPTHARYGLLGFCLLGTNGSSAVPALIRIAAQDAYPGARELAILSLGHVGPPAKVAVPYLLQWANADPKVRGAAIESLGRIGPPAKAAVPHLLQWATNTDTEIQTLAKLVLLKVDRGAAEKAGFTNEHETPFAP